GRKVKPETLLDCLADSQGERARFGLLLALGEYPAEEVPPERRETLQRQLVDWYRNDPSSGIHGACGWLLRPWGLGDQAAAGGGTPVACGTGREWFVEKVGDDCLTFVVFPPGEFVMGSPEGEKYREKKERQHRVHLTRAFAVADREVTRGQFEKFRKIPNID